MPQDHVYPCPHCGGTGEARGGPPYRIRDRYQDGWEWHPGEFATLADASAELARLEANRDYHGVMFEVVDKDGRIQEYGP